MVGNFGTHALRRKFDEFWNAAVRDSPRFPVIGRAGGDRRGEFWSNESSFADVFQNSKIARGSLGQRQPTGVTGLRSEDQRSRYRLILTVWALWGGETSV